MVGSAAPTSAAPNQFSAAAAQQMEAIVCDLRRMYQERNEALQEVAQAHHEALFLLAKAAEYKDEDTGVHNVRVGFLAEALALHYGCSREWALLLRKAAPMHDVGKIGVPDSVLKKPGPLTPQERELMNRHPAIGAEMLGKSRIVLFQLAAEVAHTHHERWDGTGYPRGLAGEAIGLAGRIVGLVDFYDALTMERIYRPAFSDGRAVSMIQEQRGRAFDPALVDTFMAHREAMSALRLRITQRRMSFTDLVQSESTAP